MLITLLLQLSPQSNIILVSKVACVHPPPPLEGGDDGCDTGYARLILSPRLHVKPLTSVITA